MRTRTFKLTAEQINELQGAYQQCKDGATKIRYQAVRLYGSGYATAEVLRITGCSQRRLLGWSSAYQAYGIAGLIDRRVGGNSAKMTADEQAELQTKLHSYRPNQVLRPGEYQGNGEFWSARDLSVLLEREYGIVYRSPNSYRNVLKRVGLSRQRPAQQYKSRSEAKVMDFDESLEKKF